MHELIVSGLFGAGVVGTLYVLLKVSRTARLVLFYGMVTLPLWVVAGAFGLAVLGAFVTFQDDVIAGLMLVTVGLAASLFAMWAFIHIWEETFGPIGGFGSGPGIKRLLLSVRSAVAHLFEGFPWVKTVRLSHVFAR